MVNVMDGVIAYLKQNLVVDAEVDGAVFGYKIPDGVVKAMPMPCVLVTAAGGSERADYISYSTPRFDLICYGTTNDQAARVAISVWEALHSLMREVHGGVLLHSAIMSSGGTPWLEPGAGWPGKVITCVVQASTDTVA